MGFWDKEPDEAAVREAMKRLRRDKEEERAAAVGAFFGSITGGLGLIWGFLHVATFVVLLALVGGATAQWLKLGPLAGLAVGLIPAVAWWKWHFRRRHPVLAVPAGFFGAVLIAWVLLNASAK
jgi:hypothetical protein